MLLIHSSHARVSRQRTAVFSVYGLTALLAALLFVGSPLLAVARGTAVAIPIPDLLRATDFTVTLNGQPVPLAHAAASYDYLSFTMTGPVEVAITARDKGFWDAGVDIQPWRLGIRPTRTADTIRFRLDHPAMLSISRPGDFLNHARMIFVFATPPVAPPPTGPAVHVVAPGLHPGSLNPKSGETWYLTPGAVIQGSINLWHVSNVKILGRGVVLYDGPQDPNNDQGWMQRPDWHCIGALDAHQIQIEGVTCLVRSRTWSIQMKDSTGFLYDDLRVIGGNPGNANQDGMDWLGGGDAVVRNSFFRASDDVFAMQGNWPGYDQAAMVKPGHPVDNILVENSELSTSISNIVRAGWPQKRYSSHHFTLRDSDILHSGIGSCGLPFALFTYWGANGASGDHSDFTFQNLFLDDWYSLVQMQQRQPQLHDFTFHNIWALGQPPLVGSLLSGNVHDIHLENVKYGQHRIDSDPGVPLTVADGASEPAFAPSSTLQASFTVREPVLVPGQRAHFEASRQPHRHVRYTWLFGDGTTATGRRVHHRFPDALGTQLDGAANGAGSFRVLLHVEDKHSSPTAAPQQDWAEQAVAVVARWLPAMTAGPTALPTAPGLSYQIFPGQWPDFPNFDQQVPMRASVASTLAAADSGGFTRFAVAYEGFVDIPSDGGYRFALLSRDGARLLIDHQPVAATGPQFAEVCGSPDNAMRYATGTIGLRAGKHRIRLEALETVSVGSPQLLWEGPAISLQPIPAAAFSHRNLPQMIGR